MDQIIKYDGDNVSQVILKKIEKYTKEPFFNFEGIKGKSLAAAYLCGWVVNLEAYNKEFKNAKKKIAAVKALDGQVDHPNEERYANPYAIKRTVSI